LSRAQVTEAGARLTASALLSTATEPGIAEHSLRSSNCELVN
jgi:hypothetical protein